MEALSRRAGFGDLPLVVWKVRKIVSGGQTGVDRAALDWALEHGIPCGGWCPAGRLAEDGPIDERYPLRETPSADTAQRTEWNVRDSDGTLILMLGAVATGGTALTEKFAIDWNRPCLLLSKTEAVNPLEKLDDFLERNSIATLNVAGPRASTEPGAGEFARAVLESASGGIVS